MYDPLLIADDANRTTDQPVRKTAARWHAIIQSDAGLQILSHQTRPGLKTLLEGVTHGTVQAVLNGSVKPMRLAF